MIIPSDKKELTAFAVDLVETCRVSQGQRSAAYRQYSQWIETGRMSGGLALANMMYSHIDRLHSHIFSPTDLRFSLDFENHYDAKILSQADMTARVLTREWERRNIDTVFAAAVREGLAYGCCPIKQLVKGSGDGSINISARMVMPWQFGVYNESVADIEEQEAVVETVFLTKPEVWRRVAHLPDANKLFSRIISGADKNEGSGTPTSFMHQVLSTAVLDTSLQNMMQDTPGGLVQLTTNPSFANLGPQIGPELYPMHELWVKDDDTNDYVTIQLVAPDILVAPQFARKNLFCSGVLPYGVVRPNDVANYFWGRSECVDLMMLQQLFTTTLDDTKRIIGQQFDKLLAFSGDTITDEIYGQFRSQGYMNLGQGGKIEDVTPKLPDGIFTFINLLEQLMEKIGGFSNILSGKGEQGVRAGNHAETLMRTASPRLRDRALLVERQCAIFADATLSVMEAKDASAYWTEEDTGASGEFLLSQLPEDRRVSVDSHSSSPVYQEDHKELLAWGVKSGFIGGDSAIDFLSFPNKDILKQRLRKMEAARAAQQQQQFQREEQLQQVKEQGKHAAKK